MPKGEVSQELRRILNDLVTQRILEEAGNYAIALINLRVDTGRDIANNPFEQYSEKYLARKIARGRYSGRVDLNWTGNMMRDMKTHIIRSAGSGQFELEIGYIADKSSTESINKATWHNESGAGKKKVLRKFVGLSEGERNQILGWFQNRMQV